MDTPVESCEWGGRVEVNVPLFGWAVKEWNESDPLKSVRLWLLGPNEFREGRFVDNCSIVSVQHTRAVTLVL